MNSKSDMKQSEDRPDAQAAKGRQRIIGARLQAMYDDVVRQGVPDDFEQMLAALDELDDTVTESGPAAGQEG